MDINYRLVTKEDAYEWYTVLDEVWRSAYAHIFPKEVFDTSHGTDSEPCAHYAARAERF